MEEAAEDILLTFPPQDIHNYESQHFAPRKNFIFERAKFNSKLQEVGESVEYFIQALFRLNYIRKK